MPIHKKIIILYKKSKRKTEQNKWITYQKEYYIEKKILLRSSIFSY